MKDLLHASAALCALSMVLCAGCAADKPGSESGAEKTGMESSVRQEILHGMAAYAPSVLEAAGERRKNAVRQRAAYHALCLTYTFRICKTNARKL